MPTSWSPVLNPQGRISEEHEEAEMMDLPPPRTLTASEDRITGVDAPSDLSGDPVWWRHWWDDGLDLPISLDILRDAAIVILSLSPAVFVCHIASKNGSNVDEHYPGLQNALRVLATAFPFLFAFIMGHLFAQIARWKLEMGTSLNTLEQLMGSQTLGSTLATHFKLRIFNVKAMCIILFWCFSPLGGQSFLRILSTTPSVSHATVYYYNTLSLGGQDTPSTRSFSESIVYMSVFAGRAMQGGAADFLGNVRIPFQDSLVPGNQSGWAEIGIDDAQRIEYSANFGVPIENTGTQYISPGNTTFTMESTYLSTACETLQNITFDNASSLSTEIKEAQLDQGASVLAISEEELVNITEPWDKLRNGTWYGTQRPNQTTTGSLWNLGIDRFVDEWLMKRALTKGRSWPDFTLIQNETELEAGPTHILFQAVSMTTKSDGSLLISPDDPMRIFNTKCLVSQKYVESRIECFRSTSDSRGECRVAAQRESQQKRPSGNITVISFPESFALISTKFPIATQITEARQDPLLDFLTDDSMANTAQLKNTSRTIEFSRHLGRLLNTFILSYTAGFILIPYRKTLPTELVRSAEGTETSNRDVYKISIPWLAACLVSCIVLFAAGLLGFFAARASEGPDVLGSVSTILRESRHVKIPEGAELLDAPDLSRMMKDDRFRFRFKSTSTGAVDDVGILPETGHRLDSEETKRIGWAI